MICVNELFTVKFEKHFGNAFKLTSRLQIKQKKSNTCHLDDNAICLWLSADLLRILPY